MGGMAVEDPGDYCARLENPSTKTSHQPSRVTTAALCRAEGISSSEREIQVEEILLIDDEIALCSMLIEYLGRYGFKQCVIIASNPD